MSRTEITGIECDRCGEAVQVAKGEPNPFGRVYAASNGRDVVGTAENPADLCGGCLEGLVSFIGGCSLVGATVGEKV